MRETIKNKKIPYPTEGVIRTAALDDTSSPEESVQIAVNMNFDRIGAFQTRLGLTEYADDVDAPVRNFGTLNALSNPGGYERIYQYPETLAPLGGEEDHIEIAKVDSTHVLAVWRDVADSDKGKAVVLEVSPFTGQFTVIGTPVEFAADQAAFMVLCQIDDNHYTLAWQGASNDGFIQTLSVNLSTYAVTVIGSPLEFDTTNYQGGAFVKINSTHVIGFWDGAAAAGLAQVFAIDATTFAVTAVGSPLTVDAANFGDPSAVQHDANHFVCFWDSSATGKGQVFEVDLGTFAVTANGSPLTTDAANSTNNSCAAVNGNNYINFWTSSGGVGKAQTFHVDGSYVLSFLGALFTFEATTTSENSCVSAGDGEHYVNFWKGVSNEGYAQIFTVNQITFDITDVGSPTNFSAMGAGSPDVVSGVLVSDYKIVALWVNADLSIEPGYFSLLGDSTSVNYLYVQDGNSDISNWNGSSWTVRRSGLQTEGKARFAQYLNYIWMVNGNQSIGDPVATSNGGTFGTDLVPEFFPPGDFIQAGFEGRVWVADKLYDVVYFTDIVQFTPPDTYELTFSDDNFIKNFSPQNGQTITGLITTPRALLLFKQDSIFRIYGAFSVDNYPAYNVGTYSNESIIQTKDGIYFHHSSGFYKFSYDSQPVEISRRIIDFVQAIPRSYYENITGIYDGFDAVEWAIGPVTVEGVAFTNCVVRYTISTQIWTIYDYPGNNVTALIQYDDGTDLNMIMGTSGGRVNKMDDGFTDLGEKIYFEMIDRWRSYADVYAKTQSIEGINVYNENAGGTKIQYQTQKSRANVWEDIGTIDENASALIPNATTEDFNAARLRISGFTSGNQIVFHGIEILDVTIKGYDKN